MSLLRIKKDVLLVGLSLLFSLTAVFSFYHLLPVFLMRKGFSEKVLGYLYTLFLFSYNFGQLAGGIFLRKITSKVLYTLSTFLVGICLFIITLPKSKFEVVLILFLIYFLWGVQVPPQGIIIHDAEEDSVRGFSQIEFFALLGILIGPFLGYLLLKYLSLKTVLLVAGMIELFVALLRYMVRHGGKASGLVAGFPKLSREILVITVFVSLSFFVFYSTSDGPFIPAILKNTLSLNLREISLVFGIATMVSIAFIPIFYFLSQRFGMWYVMGVSVIFHGFLIYLWSLHYRAIIILIIAFVTVQPVYTYFMPLIMENVEKEERGSIIGAVGFISGTIGSLSPMLLVYSKNPFFYTFIVSILAGIIVLSNPLKNEVF